jgi:hypothetical protein
MFQIPVHPGKYTSDFMTRGDKGFRSKTGDIIKTIAGTEFTRMSYLVEDINNQKVELMNRLRVNDGSGISHKGRAAKPGLPGLRLLPLYMQAGVRLFIVRAPR